MRPAEEALATITGIKRTRSTATADGANIFIEFSDWDRNIAIAASDARERMDAIRDDFPEDLQRFHIFKLSSSDEPVLKVRLASQTDLTCAYDMLDREFKRRIKRNPGVAKVEIAGAPPNEVEIAIAPYRLTVQYLGLNDLSKRLSKLNFSVSAG